MIEAIVSLNGELFSVLAAGDVYDGERLDYNSAVQAAADKYRLIHPLDPIDFATLEVTICRAFAGEPHDEGRNDGDE